MKSIFCLHINTGLSVEVIWAEHVEQLKARAFFLRMVCKYVIYVQLCT